MMHAPFGVFWIASAAVLAACRTGGDAPRQSQSVSTPNVVSLTATEYSIQAPDTVPPGWTTLRLTNQGQGVHYGHIVHLEPGRTVQELVEAYAEAIRTSGPRPKWVTRFGGPGGAPPGGTASVTQFLQPGNYVWICPVEDSSGAPHFGKGEFKPFVVRAAGAGETNSAAAPEAGLVIRLMDFSFALDSTVRAGRHTIRVENTGAEPHDLSLMKLAPGKSVEDVRTWLNPERARRSDRVEQPAPSLESLGALAGGIAAIAPGMESFFEADLTPGEYALFCMVTAPDGRSHIEHGMTRQFRVP